MAKRRTRGGPRTPANGSSATERRARKEELRQAREREARRQALRTGARRALTVGVAGVLALGILWFVQRPPAPRPIPAAAIAAARSAGCSGAAPQFATAPSRAHLAPGQDPGYTVHPTTAGPHNPVPLPSQPRVYTTPVDETAAVHSLEHGAVIVYYRPVGDGGVTQRVVHSLTALVPSLPYTYLIPYPDLPAGEGLAIAAWNQLQTCPVAITASPAGTIVRGFVTAFACTRNAPEARSGSC
jgi:hypothetical protein